MGDFFTPVPHGSILFCTIFGKEETAMVGFEEMRGELLERIEDLLKRKQYTALRDLLSDLAPADIASLFEDLDEDSIPLLFRLLPKEPAAEVFVELDPDAQEMLIRGFSNTELKEVLDELYLDDAVDIVEEMPANVVKRILKHADPDTRKSINEILKYPDDSAGALMTTEFVDLKRDMTVEDALKRIRRTGTDKETINVCYVVDPARKLQGIVSLRTILLAEEDDVIEEIMETHVISVTTLEDKEDVAQTFSKYDFRSLTRKTASSASSPLTTPLTSWKRKRPRTSKRWRPCCRRTSPISKQASGIPSSPAFPGCCS
jgi:magnesium transporter